MSKNNIKRKKYLPNLWDNNGTLVLAINLPDKYWLVTSKLKDSYRKNYEKKAERIASEKLNYDANLNFDWNDEEGLMYVEYGAAIGMNRGYNSFFNEKKERNYRNREYETYFRSQNMGNKDGLHAIRDVLLIYIKDLIEIGAKKGIKLESEYLL